MTIDKKKNDLNPLTATSTHDSFIGLERVKKCIMGYYLFIYLFIFTNGQMLIFNTVEIESLYVDVRLHY